MSFEKFTGTRAVAPQHAFDAARLAAWMRSVGLEADALDIAQFKGGQSNPTYLVTAGAHRYALRRKPPGKLLPSAHAVDREYRVMTALADTDVPVPKTYALCEDAEVIGTAFFLMDYVEGRVLNVTARGRTVKEAQQRAYAVADKIKWPEGFFRRDIGWRAAARGL